MTTSREIRLKSRPRGMPTLANFQLVAVEMPEPEAGQVLVKNLYMTLDPAMRPMMDERESYTASYEVGKPLFGLAVGQVIESRNPTFPRGCCVVNYSGWREHFITTGADLTIVDQSLAPVQSYLYIMGMVGATAYFGMQDVGKPQPGETVLVSAAAGAIGLVACQIAKLVGCHVVGSCGSDEKVEYLLNQIGIDAAINYKKVNNIEAAVRAHAPKGIDLYFDNVGGAHADAALQLLKDFGRFVVCGQISDYQDERAAVGPRNFTLVNTKRLRIQGFLIFDYVDRLPEYSRQMGQWIAEGKIKWRETIRGGLENAPQAFLDMFHGRNIGKMMVKMGEAETWPT